MRRDASRAPQLRVALVVTLVTMLARVPYLLRTDTWFNLVLGRDIARQGLLHQNILTWAGWHAPVVDLQWLAHLVFFAGHEVLGLAALVVCGALLITVTMAGAAWGAVRRGATPGRTLLVLLVMLPALVPQLILRAQTLVLPFLVLLPLLLADDVRTPRQRTWWLVPMTVLWGNLHGSALLAPLFSGVAGMARVLDAWRRGDPWPWALLGRDLLRTGLLAAALLASPYGTDVLHYYGATAGSDAFRAYLTEWQPASWHTTPEVLLAALVVLAVLVRTFRAAPVFELVVLSGMAVMTLRSVRHATPLAMASLALLPPLADLALGRALRMDSDAVLRALARIGVPVAGLLWVVGVPMRATQMVWQLAQSAVPAAVVAALPRQGPVLVDEADADRLVWYAPALAGRITHDARVETLPVPFLDSLSTLYRAPRSAMAQAFLRPFSVVVVNAVENPRLHAAMEQDPAASVIAQDATTTAFRRMP